MSKIETSIACIECGNKLLEKMYPMLLEYNNNIGQLSCFEKETYNATIGSQFALICEYYLKGLLIPNIKVIIPEELKNKIDSLTEEQELMIIVSDIEKIKKEPVLNKLDKKELNLLLSTNSLKSFGHSLISLLGTETYDTNKRIILPQNIRNNILAEMKSRLYNHDAKTFKEKNEFRDYITTPIQTSKEGKRLEIGDKIIEESLSLSSVSDAFPKGRYGIFDGFSTDVDWITGLAFSIRKNIKHQFNNLIEVFRSKDDPFGKFIYPDKETKIIITGMGGNQEEYEMVPSFGFYSYGTEIFWNASRTIPTAEETEYLNVLLKYDENARVSNWRIYLEEFDGVNIIHYTKNGQNKQINLINGKIYEILPESVYMKEDDINIYKTK